MGYLEVGLVKWDLEGVQTRRRECCGCKGVVELEGLEELW